MRHLYRLLAALILVGGSAAAWFLPGVSASRFDAERTAGSAIQRRQAIAFHERRLREDPQSALDMAQLGALLMEEGRMRANDAAFAQAELLARRSLGLRSRRNGRSAALLTTALVAQHRFAEAVDVARDLVRWDPETPAYRALLAEVLMEVGAYQEAITQLGMIREHRDDLGIAPRFARWAELTGQPGEARRILTAARDESRLRTDLGADQRAWFDLRLADMELRHGNLRNASAAIRSGLKQSPGDWRLVLTRARLDAARGEWDKAIESAERIISDVPTPDAFALLASAHTARGRAEEANAYVMALDVVSQRRQDGIHRSWAYTMLDHGGNAADVVTMVARDTLVRRDSHTLDLLAWALHRAGRSREALPIARRAVAMGSVEPALRYHVGTIELAAGMPGMAREHFQVALRGERALAESQVTEIRRALDSLSALGYR
jgi:tetratricopeptide (TPR) repeat protein